VLLAPRGAPCSPRALSHESLCLLPPRIPSRAPSHCICISHVSCFSLHIPCLFQMITCPHAFTMVHIHPNRCCARPLVSANADDGSSTQVIQLASFPSPGDPRSVSPQPGNSERGGNSCAGHRVGCWQLPKPAGKTKRYVRPCTLHTACLCRMTGATACKPEARQCSSVFLSKHLLTKQGPLPSTCCPASARELLWLLTPSTSSSQPVQNVTAAAEPHVAKAAAAAPAAQRSKTSNIHKTIGH